MTVTVGRAGTLRASHWNPISHLHETNEAAVDLTSITEAYPDELFYQQEITLG